MEIKIISTEIIKPSSPTPDHLKTHKGFLPTDYSNPYFFLVLFYSTKGENPIEVSSHLKNSLSKTLTYYYPLAGQTKDKFSIDCNDHGAFFVETQVVVGEMSMVIENKEQDVVKQLLPLKGNFQELTTTYAPSNLIVQVNYFGCGGIAISICYNHHIVDGTTAAYFAKSWSEVARGANDIKTVILDYSLVDRPHDAMSSLASLKDSRDATDHTTNTVVKSFIFDRRKIDALKQKIGNGPFLNHPTRFEAIASLISGTRIKNIASRESNVAKQFSLVFPINLRDKVNPPLPPQSIDNLVTVTIAKLPIHQTIDYNMLAAKIREYLTSAVDQYTRNIAGGGFGEGLSSSVIFYISDISRLPFYEADFGWGKPLWLSFVMESLHQVAYFIQASDGEGVEVLIGLSKEEMEKFEQDPEILTYSQSSISKRARL